jgi:hypothetical protein
MLSCPFSLFPSLFCFPHHFSFAFIPNFFLSCFFSFTFPSFLLFCRNLHSFFYLPFCFFVYVFLSSASVFLVRSFSHSLSSILFLFCLHSFLSSHYFLLPLSVPSIVIISPPPQAWNQVHKFWQALQPSHSCLLKIVKSLLYGMEVLQKNIPRKEQPLKNAISPE